MTEDLLALLDGLIESIGSGDEVRKARDAYEARTAKIHEDDPRYDQRAAAFLEWYVLERPLAREGVAPIVVALRREAHPERRAAWRAWTASHRSLFAIDALTPGKVLLSDLVAGPVFEVEERRKLPGVAPGDLLEARVVGFRGRVIFGRTFLYHPAEARSVIEARVARLRQVGASRVDVVDALAALRLKADRYKHVAPGRVYAEER